MRNIGRQWSRSAATTGEPAARSTCSSAGDSVICRLTTKLKTAITAPSKNGIRQPQGEHLGFAEHAARDRADAGTVPFEQAADRAGEAGSPFNHRGTRRDRRHHRPP
jgi:hypothetical protein